MSYLRDLAYWPKTVPLPKAGVFLFYDPTSDKEYQVLPEQVAPPAGSSTPEPASVEADDITDATEAGRNMLRAADVASQLALVDKFSYPATADHAAFTRLYGEAGAVRYLMDKLVALGGATLPGNAPTVTGFLPAKGAEGASVTLTGAKFTDATSVSFNGTPASFQVVNATTIQAVVPTGATTGPVAVSTASGTGTSAASFTVGVSSGGGATPQLTAALALSLAQITLGASVGYSITASGGTAGYTYAVTATDVSTGATFDLGTAKSGTWQPPAVDQYAIDSVVTDAAGKVVETATRYLNVIPAANRIPVADAGSDATVSAGTTSVALMGRATDPDGDAITGHAWRQITGPNSATGMPASSQNVVAGGLVAGTYQFGYRATDARGGQSDEDYVLVTVQAAAAPVINSISPASGAVGTQVTISGANFGDTQGSSTVKFNGVLAIIVGWAAALITVTVPSGCETGPITVTTPSGTATGPTYTVTTGGQVVLADTDAAVLVLDSQSNLLSNALRKVAFYAPLSLSSATITQAQPSNLRILNVQTNQLEPIQEGYNTRPNFDNTYPTPHSYHMSDTGIWQNGVAAYGYDFDAITMVYFISQWFQQAYPGKQLVICQAAVGGQPRSTMLKGNTDPATPWYARSMNQYNRVAQLLQAEGKTVRLIAIAAHQGESDQSTAVSTYSTQLHQMWTDYDGDLPNGTFKRIEFLTGRHADTGTPYDNPHNGTKTAWASEDKRNVAIPADYRVCGEDRIHEEANTQKENARRLVNAAFGTSLAAAADVAQAAPSVSYDAASGTATFTPFTSDWQRQEFYYQLGSDAPVQLINSWSVALPRSLAVGEFKAWVRAVPGRAQSTLFTNSTAWNISSRATLPSGYLQWLPDRGAKNTDSSNATVLTATNTIAHASTAANGWNVTVPARQRLRAIPSATTGEILRIRAPRLARNQAGVVFGTSTTPTPASKNDIVGVYQDTVTMALAPGGGGLSDSGYSYPDPPGQVDLIYTANGDGTATVTLSVPNASFTPFKINTSAPLYLAAALYGASGWEGGQLASQLADLYVTSDWLEEAFV